MLADPRAAAVPLWRDLSLVAGEPPRAGVVAGPDARRLLGAGLEPVFLGLAEAGRPVFAVDISAMEAGEAGPDLGGGTRFVALRACGPLLPGGDSGLLGYARAVLLWHRRQRFCGACGGPTASAEGGLLRRCADPACDAQYHPRIDPVVIMLVEDDGRVLLHRQHPWPPGMWSVPAGFVEPGETLVEAVIREVREETGVAVGDVRYVTSQPWPFPSSLMMAFTARAVGGRLTPDPHEVADAAWFGRAELADFDDRHRHSGEGRFLAHPGTVARLLLDRWLAGGMSAIG